MSTFKERSQQNHIVTSPEHQPSELYLESSNMHKSHISMAFLQPSVMYMYTECLN